MWCLSLQCVFGATGGQDPEGGPSGACHLPVLSHYDEQSAEAAACSPEEPSAGGGVQQVSVYTVGSMGMMHWKECY